MQKRCNSSKLAIELRLFEASDRYEDSHKATS